MSETKLVQVACTVCGQPLWANWDAEDDALEFGGPPAGMCDCRYTERQYDELVRRVRAAEGVQA